MKDQTKIKRILEHKSIAVVGFSPKEERPSNYVSMYMQKNGYLIIEDIFNNRKSHNEENYFKNLNKFQKFFSEIYFVQSEHLNKFSPLYDNDKLLVLVKS